MSKTLAVAFCVALTSSLTQANAETKPLRALLISGGCCHDYPNQKQILPEGISKRANVVWTIYSEGKGRSWKNTGYAGDDWYKDFDVVVHNECYGGITDVEFVERIAKAHKDGLPGVAVHCSYHSYRNAKTDEWRKFLGVTSVRHGKHAAIKVTNTNKAHPVMQGFPDEWTTEEGELYNIEKVWPTATVLADGMRTLGEDVHPCVWVNTYGKGRTFGTTLGHHNSTMTHENYLDLVTRGLLWTCGKLTEAGTPADGYAAVEREDYMTEKSAVVPEEPPKPKKKKK